MSFGVEGFTLVGRAGLEFFGVRVASTVGVAAGASVTASAEPTSDSGAGTLPSPDGCSTEASCVATGAGVDVGVAETRGVRVRRLVAAAVGSDAGVAVTVGAGVASITGVGVGVGIDDVRARRVLAGAGVAVGSGVGSGVGVATIVGAGVGVDDARIRRVLAGAGVAVGSGVGSGVGVATGVGDAVGAGVAASVTVGANHDRVRRVRLVGVSVDAGTNDARTVNAGVASGVGLAAIGSVQERRVLEVGASEVSRSRLDPGATASDVALEARGAAAGAGTTGATVTSEVKFARRSGT